MFPAKLPGRVKAVRHPAMSISDACKENLAFPQLPLLAKDAAGSVNATSASSVALGDAHAQSLLPLSGTLSSQPASLV